MPGPATQGTCLVLNEILHLQQHQQRWIRRLEPRPSARLRLFCLAHAGGGARFFAEWARLLPPSIELIALQLPGREERINDRLIDQMRPLVNGLAAVLPSWLDRPYAVFGHSMGAAVAHELCLAVQRQGLRMPTSLMVSGREGPNRQHGGDLHLAEDERLLMDIFELGGSPLALRDSKELQAMALPILRNDYKLIETYRPDPLRERLRVPVEVFVGSDDPELNPGDAQAWEDETELDMRLHRFEGGHFYLVPQRQALLQCIARCLGASHLQAVEMP
ncbi:thioesterase [Pseudomonas corrugata]|uniref:Thioesterase n=1 Tax=Pseudomonas corrugata TaxID=47879 RepID=A0A7Y5Z176_9PSED|nr:alpha/beta fold hydrolase [Pseudomonas corrugata]NUT85006.1 thioesterase [Pseudomonas corrugata]